SSYGIVLNGGGTISNGAISATSAVLYGLRDGVIAYNTSATVTNYGTISGPGVAAVNLTRGGTVTHARGARLFSYFVGVQLGGTVAGALTNLSGAQIYGGYGLRGNFNTVANAGTITGTNRAGIALYNSGSINNTAAGLINGG